MTENYVVNHKMCPKCPEVVMNKLNTSAAIPTYIGKSGRKLNDKTPAISLTDAWTVEVYSCPICRFVELYAD
jgi:phage FluMu protein Com